MAEATAERQDWPADAMIEENLGYKDLVPYCAGRSAERGFIRQEKIASARRAVIPKGTSVFTFRPCVPRP